MQGAAQAVAQTVEAVVEAPVIVVPPKVPAEPAKPAQVGDLNIAPNTTAAEDLVKAGQRHINRVWEYTQAGVALMVTGGTLFVAGKLALADNADTAAFLLLSNVFFMVMGMYFQRTNHTKQSFGPKDHDGR